MTSLKSKLSSDSQDSVDVKDVELQQKRTEIILYSPPQSIRNSVADISSGIIKRVKRTKPKYQRSTTEGVGMTALLVRTLMTAPSLDSIAEHTDNDLPTTVLLPKKSESLINLPTRKFGSEKPQLKVPNLSESSNEIKASDSNLSSNYSVSSCTMTSSSEDDDELLNPHRKEVVLIDADTISMVVKSVLAQEEGELDDYSWIKPSSYDSELNELGMDDGAENTSDRKRLTRQASFEYRHSNEELHKILRTGVTHVIRTSKKEKDPKTILVENENYQETIENMLSSPMDDDEQNWIQPGSTADEPEVADTRQSSVLHDLKENISERIHNLQEHMHHQRPHHEIKHHGLLSNAMESMLLEQASLLGVQSSIFIPDLEDSKLELKKRSSSMDSLKRLLGSPFRRRSNESASELNLKKGNLKNTSGLVDSAMKTMLMGTANIIEGVGVHPADSNSKPEPEKKRLQTIYSKSYDDSKSSKDSKSQEDNKSMDENVEEKPLGETLNETALQTESDKNFASLITLTKPGIDPVNNKCNRLQVPPVVILTKETNSPRTKHRRLPKSPSKSNLNSHLSVSHNELLTVSNLNQNKTNRKLISVSNCDLINITNKTALLAPTPYHPHVRSSDVITSPGKSVSTTGSNISSTAGHMRTESIGSKIPPSSSAKVASSATDASITTTATAATTATSISTDKDSKENKDLIYRRSSDSDLSVTPKGMFLFNQFRFI